MAEHFYPQIAEFDQLLQLAKEAPEQLDLLQQHLNETCIAGASTERSAWKLRRLLMQVGEIKSKYQHPQLVCQQLQLLLQQVLFDAPQTDQTLKQTTRARGDASKSRDAAKVILLKR